jgi:hypothetical protein
MKKLLMIMAVSTLTVSGCSTTHLQQPSTSFMAPRAVESPKLKADITVGQKISGTATSTQVLGIFKFGPNKFADGVNFSATENHSLPGLFGFNADDPFASIKAAAAYQATSASKSDIIVAPRYLLETKNYFLFNKTTATVVGYKGTINSIK